MFFSRACAYSAEFISMINDTMKENGYKRMTRVQCSWMAFCLTAIICSSTINWDEFERSSFGRWKAKTLGAMMRRSKIAWDKLLETSIRVILNLHGVTSGVLVADDTDRERSKNVSMIFGAFKVKDKKTGGYVIAQNIVALILVTDKVSIPVGFSFYLPDPKFKEWQTEDRKLKKKGVVKSKRPKKPAKNPDFPTKLELAAKLIENFVTAFPVFNVKCIAFDCAYCTKEVVMKIKAMIPNVQIVSQIRSNMIVSDASGRKVSVKEYFANKKPIESELVIRGGIKNQKIQYLSARLYVKAHGQVLHVVAIRYSEDQDYRYIIGTDLTWRALDILRCYTFRWLIEVAFEDWKLYEGYGVMAMQQGAEGACRGVYLSLLADHLLLFYPEQLRLSKLNLPLLTVGAVATAIRLEAACDCVIEAMENSLAAGPFLEKVRQRILRTLSSQNSSKKHLSGRIAALDLKPSPTLRRKYRDCA